MKGNLIKAIRLTIAAILCVVLFTGCGENTIYGEVTGVKTDTQTGVFSFVLMQDGGEPITVVTDENTHIFSWIEGVSEFDLREGTTEGIMVSVTGTTSRSTMHATQVQIDHQLVRDAYNLEDGTRIDIMIGSSYTFYCLEDGTELLLVHTPIGPENVHVGGVESLDALSQEAQHKIMDYYDAQGILYDVFETLEDAYDAYYILQDDFSTYSLKQEIVPTASNDEIIYFLTVVTTPDDGPHTHKELRLGAAFDKETGEVISMLYLFACEPEDIIPQLAAICKVDDAALIAEMEAKFRPEYVVVFPNNLEITFPAGVLSEYPTTFGMGFDYCEEVYELLHPWAIPVGNPE